MRPRSLVLVLALTAALAPPVARADHPGDRTGVGETLTIGLHMPFTGSAPVPAEFSDAASLYWRHLHETEGRLVHGRRVEIHVSDDGGSASTAGSVCHELASSSFVLLGLSNPAPTRSCAEFADARGIPYVSVGTPEDDLAATRTAFTVTPTFEARAPIVAEFIINRLGGSADRYGRVPMRLPIVDLEVPLLTTEAPDGVVRVGLVRPDAPSYDGLEERLAAEMQSLGGDLRSYTITGEGSGSEANALAHQMRAEAIDVVVLATSALFTSRLVVYADRDGYEPQLLILRELGALNRVASIFCPSPAFDGTSAFSGWPGWRDVNAGSFDPAFADAAQRFLPEHNDEADGDTLVAMWGFMKILHQMLEDLGPDPTRADLLAMLDAGYATETGVYAPVSFTADDHFGADALHRLELDCDDGTFRQRESFVAGYPADG